MEPKRFVLIVANAVFLLFGGCHSSERADPPRTGSESAETLRPEVQAVEVLSPVYTVDRIYRSMQGPQSTQEIKLVESEEPELLWLTGYEAVMVGADGESRMPQEFMCHSNLDWNPFQHNKVFGQKATNARLFTLSQGQLDIDFPPEFGIPVLSRETLRLTTQVLNLNEPQTNRRVRHKVRIGFARDRDLQRPYKPLFGTSAYVLVSLEGEAVTFGINNPSGGQEHASCLPGENASGHTFQDGLGRKFSGHYVVKPGRYEYRTLSTRQLNLPYDTTIHYVAVHLHPFAESVELRDLTTGETVYRSKARNFQDKMGLEHVDYYSSAEGVPVYKDHEYEIVSVYNNTSGEDQDSMAVMLIYYLDKGFEKPKLAAK